MTPQNILAYRPLEQWPELAAAFVTDLSRCQSSAQARELLEGLTHAEKQAVYDACPSHLQRWLWRLR